MVRIVYCFVRTKKVLCTFSWRMEFMKRYGILLPIAVALLFAASCSLDQLGDSLTAMGTNILGPAPVDATGVTNIADNTTTTNLKDGPIQVKEDSSILIHTGNKDVRIEGLNLNLTQDDSILSNLSANEIASIGMTLEVQGDSSALFDAMNVPVENEDMLKGLRGTATIFSDIINSISSSLNDLPVDIKGIESGIKAISSSAYSPTKGDLLLLQITQSLVFDVLDVVTDANGELLTDFNIEMLEGESVQSVISSAGVLIGFAQVLQNGNETAGNQSLITTVNDLLDQLQDYIDNLGNAGGEAV